MTAQPPRRLGRGLGALIPGGQTITAAADPTTDLQRIPISRIGPNPFQPRHEFEPVALAELQASMQATGLLQPITVRRQGDGFELVAGERRLRAATNLGWSDIPAVVRDFDEQTMLVLALVENLQRADLNAIEEARGYRRLIDEFKLTQQQVADVVGKNRTTVTNLLRVLGLAPAVQQMVIDGRLSAGHARALLGAPAGASIIDLATDAATNSLSVRELERRVRDLSTGATTAPGPDAEKAPPRARSTNRELSPAARRVTDDLRRYLQTDVHIQLSGDSAGTVSIAFYSNDDLDRVLDLILRDRRSDF
jgi:ParB family transcriptional regulator, chromosome partitioning protein